MWRRAYYYRTIKHSVFSLSALGFRTRFCRDESRAELRALQHFLQVITQRGVGVNCTCLSEANISGPQIARDMISLLFLYCKESIAPINAMDWFQSQVRNMLLEF